MVKESVEFLRNETKRNEKENSNGQTEEEQHRDDCRSDKYAAAIIFSNFDSGSSLLLLCRGSGMV